MISKILIMFAMLVIYLIIVFYITSVKVNIETLNKRIDKIEKLVK